MGKLFVEAACATWIKPFSVRSNQWKTLRLQRQSFSGLLSGVTLSPNHGSQQLFSHMLGSHSAGESRTTIAGRQW